MKVLVVGDDPHDAGMLSRFCRHLGWTSSIEPDGRGGLDRALAFRPQLLLIHLHIPFFCGLELCKSVRAARLETIIIVIDGADTGGGCLAAFEAGADDYMRKPISLPELKARIDARTRLLSRGYTFGNVHLDWRRKRAFCHGKDMRLTRIEFDVLDVLARNLGRPVPVSVLAQEVWGHAVLLKSGTYRVTISNLRRRLRTNAASVEIPASKADAFMLQPQIVPAPVARCYNEAMQSRSSYRDQHE